MAHAGPCGDTASLSQCMTTCQVGYVAPSVAEQVTLLAVRTDEFRTAFPIQSLHNLNEMQESTHQNC